MTWWRWTLRLLPAIILGQTLFFKFTGAPEAVQLFTALGVEPWGRWLVGSLELVTAVALLSPLYAWGALLALGLMAGAILSHLTVLGIVSSGDGGLLFGLAIVVFLASGALVWLTKDDLFKQMRALSRR